MDNLYLVKEEDKNLIQDIISLLDKLQQPKRLCKGWVVNPEKTYYEVIGNIDTTNDASGEWEVFLDDMDLIRQLDPYRIPSISLRMNGTTPQIKIRVIPRSERVVIHSTDILRVQKKRRFWGVGS